MCVCAFTNLREREGVECVCVCLLQGKQERGSVKPSVSVCVLSQGKRERGRGSREGVSWLFKLMRREEGKREREMPSMALFQRGANPLSAC